MTSISQSSDNVRAQSRMELLGVPLDVRAEWQPEDTGMSGRQASHMSKFFLKVASVQSRFLRLAGMQLNSLGPSTNNDCSLKERIAARVPDRGGTAASVPCLGPEFEASIIPQEGTNPFRDFQVYKILYRSCLLSTEERPAALSLSG